MGEPKSSDEIGEKEKKLQKAIEKNGMGESKKRPESLERQVGEFCNREG